MAGIAPAGAGSRHANEQCTIKIVDRTVLEMATIITDLDIPLFFLTGRFGFTVAKSQTTSLLEAS